MHSYIRQLITSSHSSPISQKPCKNHANTAIKPLFRRSSYMCVNIPQITPNVRSQAVCKIIQVIILVLIPPSLPSVQCKLDMLVPMQIDKT